MAVGVGVGGAVQFVQFNATRMPVLINSRLPFTPSRRAGLFLSISSIGCFLPCWKYTVHLLFILPTVTRWMILRWMKDHATVQKEPSKYLFLSLFNANRVLPVIVVQRTISRGGKCTKRAKHSCVSCLRVISILVHSWQSIEPFHRHKRYPHFADRGLKFNFKVQSLRRARWNSRVRRSTCNYICLPVPQSSISIARVECCSHVETVDA